MCSCFVNGLVRGPRNGEHPRMRPGTESRRRIGARISQALRRAGISQNELARRLEKASSAVSGWVSGRTQPSLEELADICRMTGVTADSILGLSGAPSTPAAVDPRLVGRLLRKLRDVARDAEQIGRM